MEGPKGGFASSDATGDVGGKEASIEDRLEGLKVCGEEEEDLDLSEELEELVKGVR
jgi:hypothetical protein